MEDFLEIVNYFANNLAGYNVYRNNTKINTTLVISTTYIETNVTNDTPYSYCITAVDNLGNKSSPSTSVSATPNFLEVRILDIIPSDPTGEAAALLNIVEPGYEKVIIKFWVQGPSAPINIELNIANEATPYEPVYTITRSLPKPLAETNTYEEEIPWDGFSTETGMFVPEGIYIVTLKAKTSIGTEIATNFITPIEMTTTIVAGKAKTVYKITGIIKKALIKLARPLPKYIPEFSTPPEYEKILETDGTLKHYRVTIRLVWRYDVGAEFKKYQIPIIRNYNLVFELRLHKDQYEILTDKTEWYNFPPRGLNWHPIRPIHIDGKRIWPVEYDLWLETPEELNQNQEYVIVYYLKPMTLDHDRCLYYEVELDDYWLEPITGHGKPLEWTILIEGQVLPP